MALVTSCVVGDPSAPETPTPPAVDRCVVPESTPGIVRLKPWLDGRQFVLPVEMVPDPRSRDFYLAQMYGQILRINEATSEVRVVADLTARTMNEGGLRALAIHPTKSRAFVVVERQPVATETDQSPTGFDSELRAYDLKADGTFDLDSESLILRVNIPGGSHSMDTLRFGPDGMLYVSIGDGRTSERHVPPRYDATLLLGTILRIDVDSAAPYAIPPDNPFVSNPTFHDEVYAYGFRNPWKFSFDRKSGDLWVGDVGETRTEEVNLVVAGGNYGWPLLEGTDCHHNAEGCDSAGTVLPAFAYSHATGNSITGGFVYRGSRNEPLAGKYVYADFQAGGLWALDLTSSGARPIHLNAGEARPFSASLAEGSDGELFALDWRGGTIYALVPDTNTLERPPFPARLSETDCFIGNDPKHPSAHVVPYDINVELWSDGATKNRFIVLPTGTTLEVMADGTIELPPGGLTIKTFFEDGERKLPIETRFLGRHGNGEWVAASYEWNAEGTEAFLLHEAKEITLRSGRHWTVPAPAQCFFCHQDPNIMLGIDWRQLAGANREDPSGESDLERFRRIGILHGPTPDVVALHRLDSDDPVEDRARSYFHANCSMCHYRGNATIFSLLNLSADVPFEETGLCNEITPGAPETSRLLTRMRTRGLSPGLLLQHAQMPPVATNFVDPQGTAVVADWIRSTTRCAPP
ncbi:MAG: PQQ-dependent sugar dehydrogenase [Labilithrix sp.]|nr:PQQ-dependent sugar dehydrogenase [Labilithrix sp.]